MTRLEMLEAQLAFLEEWDARISALAGQHEALEKADPIAAAAILVHCRAEHERFQVAAERLLAEGAARGTVGEA